MYYECDRGWDGYFIGVEIFRDAGILFWVVQMFCINLQSYIHCIREVLLAVSY